MNKGIKKLIALAVSTGLVLTSAAAFADDFNPDKEDGKYIDEIRAVNGLEVKVKAGTRLGAVAKSFSNEFWRTLKEGYEYSANAIGITITVDGTSDEADETGQQTIMENMINDGYDGIMVSPISDSNMTAAVEDAADAHIPVFNVNDGLIATAPYFIGPNAYTDGTMAAEWTSSKLGAEGGDVAIVIGMAKAFAARERTAGYEDWVAEHPESNLNIWAKQNADWDRQKAKELAATWLIQNPDLKAIFCNNDDMALGVVEAVIEADSDCLVIGVDGIGEAYDSIRAGKLDATVDSFPYYMAQIAAECTLRCLAGEEMPRVVWTPLAMIDSSNVDTSAAEIINWTDSTYVIE